MPHRQIIVAYLKTKEIRLLKKIEEGGKMALNTFGLLVVLMAAFPLIPIYDKSPDIEVHTVLFDIKHCQIVSFFVIMLAILISYNILLSLININRKIKFSSLNKEIRQLENRE